MARVSPKTDRKTSMPPRGNAPGLKRKGHLRYWMARQIARNDRGFPDASIPLPPEADDTGLQSFVGNTPPGFMHGLPRSIPMSRC